MGFEIKEYVGNVPKKVGDSNEAEKEKKNYAKKGGKKNGGKKKGC